MALLYPCCCAQASEACLGTIASLASKWPFLRISGYTAACGWDKGDCEAGPEEGPEGRRKRGRKHKPLKPLDRCADGCLPADIHDSTCDEACNVSKSCQVRGPSSQNRAPCLPCNSSSSCALRRATRPRAASTARSIARSSTRRRVEAIVTTGLAVGRK